MQRRSFQFRPSWLSSSRRKRPASGRPFALSSVSVMVFPRTDQTQQQVPQPEPQTVEQYAQHLGWQPEAAQKVLAELGLDGDRGLKAMGFLKSDRDRNTAAWRAEVGRWDAETRKSLSAEEIDA